MLAGTEDYDNILSYAISLFPSRSCFSLLSFLLGFISSLPQLAWEKGFDDVVLSYAIISSLFVSVANLTKIQHDVAL